MQVFPERNSSLLIGCSKFLFKNQTLVHQFQSKRTQNFQGDFDILLFPDCMEPSTIFHRILSSTCQKKSGSHGTVISANTTGCTSDTPSRSLIDVTIDSSRISFLSFLCSFVAVSFLISISASILFDTIVLAA